MRRVYLDYNATTPVDPRVRDAMIPYLGEEYGNPSSLHWAGARARNDLEQARESIAAILGCESGEIYFTSGGTESSNMAIKGVVCQALKQRQAPVHVVASVVEHQAVLKTLAFLESSGLIRVTWIPVNAEGELDPGEFQSAVKDDTVLISAMFVNNETGNIFPVDAIGKLASERGIAFHTDAVQAVGKLPVNLKRLSVDLLSFSAHKFYGPKGAGVLYKRKGVPIVSLIHGGSQEGERRGGTQNMPGIIGCARALGCVTADLDGETARLEKLRAELEEGVLQQVPGARIRGSRQRRVCNTLNVGFDGVESESLLVALDREGIAVSSGPACASGAVEPSHVLMAMGLSPKQAKGSVRFSLGRGTSQHDIEYVLEKLPDIVKKLRSA